VAQRGLSATEKSGTLALVTTCGECQTPIRKTFSKQAYEEGLVLVKCDGCGVRHLIADHIGWMGDASKQGKMDHPAVDLATQYGERLQRGTLTPGGLGPAGEVRVRVEELEGLIEGLTEEEMTALYAKATQRKH
jgi:hypothetical protein